MKLALHINDYSGIGPPARMASALARIAATAEDTGFSRLSLTDHLWQVSMVGEEYEPMLESYTTLGYLAARTRTIELQTLVTAAMYRPPGLLAKIVTTLDVLSGGRAWLGVGAGWNEEEASGLGLPHAAQAERFAHLEETLRICLQMWSDSTDSFVGEHYQLAGTLNSPQALTRPHPRILVGGGGERVTLRIAAQYADAFNVFGGRDAGQKVARLREHCEKLGRDFDAVEKTAFLPLDVTAPADLEAALADLRRLHELGFTTVYAAVADIGSVTPLETLGSKVIPEIAAW
ncbi:LLM class F420-dependent oxidoreductase [Streptomyces sp. NPDC052052]|uniref:LLM class F420-dependent oxidoreductase n=1 Tax=Streptomyces sp. NPDC052052 TaxID=3154756 RepID=UPI00341E5B7C